MLLMWDSKKGPGGIAHSLFFKASREQKIKGMFEVHKTYLKIVRSILQCEMQNSRSCKTRGNGFKLGLMVLN